MKNIRFFLLVTIAGIIPGSCNRIPEEASISPAPEFRLVKLHYENSDGEDGVTHFYYDGRGQNYMAVWQLTDSSRSSLNSHTLDSAGRLLVKSREFSDGIRSVQHFEYNIEGKLVREDFSRSDSVTGQVIYIYRPDGRIQAADCKGLNGWFFGKIEYTWDGDHKTGADLIRDSVTIGSIEGNIGILTAGGTKHSGTNTRRPLSGPLPHQMYSSGKVRGSASATKIILITVNRADHLIIPMMNPAE